MTARRNIPESFRPEVAAARIRAPPGKKSSGHVTLTWWNNATANPLKAVYLSAIKSFEASHPGVTITNVPIQNEQFTTKMPLALQSNDPPSIFQQWGGGQEATQVKSGKLTNLTTMASDLISQLGPAAAGWQVNGQQCGIHYDLHIVGFWYRKDLFAKADITSTPTTLPGLGHEVQQWLASTTVVLYTMFVVVNWKYIGFGIILLLAGLQGVPVELREAAAIDGASSWQVTRRITLPLGIGGFGQGLRSAGPLILGGHLDSRSSACRAARIPSRGGRAK